METVSSEAGRFVVCSLLPHVSASDLEKVEWGAYARKAMQTVIRLNVRPGHPTHAMKMLPGPTSVHPPMPLRDVPKGKAAAKMLAGTGFRCQICYARTGQCRHTCVTQQTSGLKTVEEWTSKLQKTCALLEAVRAGHKQVRDVLGLSTLPSDTGGFPFQLQKKVLQFLQSIPP